MNGFRNEWKYICKESRFDVVKARLSHVLEADIHGNKNGDYYVHSLYFDDVFFTCAYDNNAGSEERYKYRIRYYGNDPKGSPIMLERKEKRDNMCRKLSCKITRSEFDILTGASGNVADLLYFTEKPLVRRFASEILAKGFAPKAIVDYARTAYTDPVTDVRVTFDKAICAAYDTDAFLGGDYMRIPLSLDENGILEVKFNVILPDYIKNAVSDISSRQDTFSKYYNAINILEESSLWKH
jgi:hypothetical protein